MIKCVCGRHTMSAHVQIIDDAGVKHSALGCITPEHALRQRCDRFMRALQKIADVSDPDPWRASDTMKAIARGTLLEGP